MSPEESPARLRPGPLNEVLAGLKRLPDLRAAIEAVLLFLMVVAAGVWAAMSGVLVAAPAPRSELLAISLSAFLIPTMSEELAFRGWLRKGAPLGAALSFVAYVLWHPFQTWLNLPFGRPEFLDLRFLSLVAWLGLACTLSRIRSGSIWPAAIIHWGAVVLWKAIYGGQ